MAEKDELPKNRKADRRSWLKWAAGALGGLALKH